MEKIGDKYFSETKYHRDTLGKGYIDWENKPDIFKEYDSAVKIELPAFFPEKEISFEILLRKRRSIRKFIDKSLSLETLSFLLWASTGIQREEAGYFFRTAPSAGALYPIETYLVVNNVEDLKKGIYHYNIKKHCLELMKLGDFSNTISFAALNQYFCKKASVVFVWSAIFYRSKWKYNERAYRYIFIDAGHIAENLALASVYVDLGSCQIGAFFDDEVNEIFDLDGVNESAIYLSPVGFPFYK